jgi:hypothetical protein
MVKIPPLAFALGMYIPMEYNTPLLVGGIIAHYVSTRSSNEKLNSKRREKGTLIASGFIAGGAIMGVLSAFLKFLGFEKIAFIKPIITDIWGESHSAMLLGLGFFVVLCAYMYWDSLRVKE